MAVQSRRLSFDPIWLARACIGLGILMLALAGLSRLWPTAVGPPLAGAEIDAAQIQATLAKLPLSFVANAGQTHPAVRFHVRGAGHTIFFTPEEVVFSASQEVDGERVSSVVRLRLVGANPEPVVEGLERLPGVANYFVGDRSQWRTGVPTYGAVAYRAVYPGIDLVYRGTAGRLKSEFRVAPGADPGQIRLAYSGVESMRLRVDGALVLATALGELIEESPAVYQEIDGRRVEVAGSYRLLGEGHVGFALGAYDADYPLVIDPTLSYSTYLGGSGIEDGKDIAVYGGYAYVTGTTTSTDFPTPNASQDSHAGGEYDAFVTKLNTAGSALDYSTYLGGSGHDEGLSIAVDSSGNAYVTGLTWSTDFITTTSAYDDTCGGCPGLRDAFVTKLDTAGALSYSTYLGGDMDDLGFGIAVDGSGYAYVTGYTESTVFPTKSAYDGTLEGSRDAFVAKLDPSQSGESSLVYSTYLGGSDYDEGYGIAVGSGYAYVTGQTKSTDFVTTTSAYQGTFGGSSDAFVTKLNEAGSALVYSTYLGGSSDENTAYNAAIAVDGSGNAYVTGDTSSDDFPTESAYDTELGGASDAFVTKLNDTGSALTYSTYLGGGSVDYGFGIAVNANGNAFVTGDTSSDDFPMASAYDDTRDGTDAFVTTLNAAGSALMYSTYLGGGSSEIGHGIALDGSGNAYVTGVTWSTDFVTTTSAYQGTFGGDQDAFVTKFPFTPNAVTLSSFAASSGQSAARLERALAALFHWPIATLVGAGLVAVGASIVALRRRRVA